MNESLRALLNSVELLEIHMDGFVARTDDRALIRQGEGLRLLGRHDLDHFTITEETPARLEVRYAMGVMLAGQEKEEKSPPTTAGVIECHMVATYAVKEPLPEIQTVEEFARTSVLFNLWPYWRQFVQESSMRLQWPIIRIPLFKFTQATHPTSSASKDASSVTQKPPARSKKRAPVA
ncbi:hypothetical protein SIID45300_02719 [Candidatus Magnetaquicoccaceae bacterium FCR-1]|uniref:Preprotein translocase subunit SecB n=1 Tax=Candidatus Magnetaquiglobus chichijimensis TaxID=3141448 RepID=A0ABQ0CCF0_9PROT